MNNTHCLTSNTSGSHWPLIVVSYLTLWGKVLSTIKVRSTMILPMHHVKPPLRTCWNKSSIYMVFFLPLYKADFNTLNLLKKTRKERKKHSMVSLRVAQNTENWLHHSYNIYDTADTSRLCQWWGDHFVFKKEWAKSGLSLTGNKWISDFCENSLTRRGVPFSNVPNTSCQRPSDKHVENNDHIYTISYFSNHVSSKTCFLSLFRDLSWKMRGKAHDLCAARHGHQSLIITLVYSYPTPRPLWDVCKTRKRFFSLRVVMKKIRFKILNL